MYFSTAKIAAATCCCALPLCLLSCSSLKLYQLIFCSLFSRQTRIGLVFRAWLIDSLYDHAVFILSVEACGWDNLFISSLLLLPGRRLKYLNLGLLLLMELLLLLMIWYRLIFFQCRGQFRLRIRLLDYRPLILELVLGVCCCRFVRGRTGFFGRVVLSC